MKILGEKRRHEKRETKTLHNGRVLPSSSVVSAVDESFEEVRLLPKLGIAWRNSLSFLLVMGCDGFELGATETDATLLRHFVTSFIQEFKCSCVSAYSDAINMRTYI
jgi:hypothetical protein